MTFSIKCHSIIYNPFKFLNPPLPPNRQVTKQLLNSLPSPPQGINFYFRWLGSPAQAFGASFHRTQSLLQYFLDKWFRSNFTRRLLLNFRYWFQSQEADLWHPNLMELKFSFQIRFLYPHPWPTSQQILKLDPWVWGKSVLNQDSNHMRFAAKIQPANYKPTTQMPSPKVKVYSSLARRGLGIGMSILLYSRISTHTAYVALKMKKNCLIT